MTRSMVTEDGCYAMDAENYRRNSGASARKAAVPFERPVMCISQFPVAQTRRKLYTDRAYDVFISAQSKHGIPSYLLEALPGKRNEGDRGYRRMVQVFGEDLLDAFHSLAAEARHRKKLRSAGGDPDLFVQHRYDPNDRFFVEVKLEDSTGRRPYKDAINEQQEVLFPLIERELCDVRLLTVRVRRTRGQRFTLTRRTAS
jgi:hypothetical protein